MTVILLTAAAGAPGVSTTAVALACNWPRPVLLVEADPTGPSTVLPGMLRGQRSHDHGILDAAVAARAGDLTRTLPAMVGELGPDVHLLAGLHRPEQAATMARVWDQLAVALVDYARAAGVDIIVDAGRLGAIGSPTPMIGIADRVVVLTRSSLPALHATRAWLMTLKQQTVDPSRIGLLVVGDGQPYLCGEITKHLGTAVIAALSWDPVGAARWSDGTRAGRRSSEFDRGVARLVGQLSVAAAAEFTAVAV